MEQMRDDLKRLEDEFVEIKMLLSEVHTAIVGNPLTKDGGIAMRLFTAEAKVLRLEENFINAERKFESRMAEQEKRQMPYNVYTKIMWLCVGGVAAMVFAYMLQIFGKR